MVRWLTALMLTALVTASAQARPEHNVSLGAGATYLSRTDAQLSALPHKGVLPRVGLGYQARGDKGVHVVDIALITGSLRSQPDFGFTWDGEDRTSGPDALTMVTMRYAVGKRIDAGPLQLNLGATNANELMNATYNYVMVGMDNYLGVFELGPYADVQLALGERNRLGLEAWTPVMAWMARNPYAVHSGQHIYNTRSNNPVKIIPQYLADGSFRTVNTYQAAHLRGSWRFDMTKRFAVSTQLRFDFLHYSKPSQLIETQTGLDVALLGRF